jgi:2-polyprenyl-3-methyl-5-hydroxy-6-metoxy-1,4-benzoquinol methylase
MAAERSYYVSKRSEMLDFMPDSYGKVLEIGCGEGDFLDCLDCDEKWGMDIDEESINVIKSKGIKTIYGRYEEMHGEIPDGYFDAIICNDVIEHMVCHDHFFQTIKTKLADGGVLIGSIPNVRFYKNLKHILFKKDWKYADEGILDRTHLRFFTEKSLKRSLKENGYQIEKMYGIRGSKKPLLRLFIALTFGKHEDIRHQQFAFAAKAEK